MTTRTHRLHTPSPASRARARRAAFSMTEMLIVMGIMTVLAASLVVLVPRLRTSAMAKAAGADIHHLSMVLTEFQEDMGFFPFKVYAPSNPDSPAQGDYIDYVLFKYLTDPTYSPSGSGTAKGWAAARDDWEFLRGDSTTQQQFLDPWGVPYYYIPSNCYLLGVRVNDPTDATPLKDGTDPLANAYGATPTPDDYRSGGSDTDHYYPDQDYYGPPPKMSEFYNPTTFQIHSKGPDQKTDYYDDRPDLVDACDRGCDPDDINNYGGGNVAH